MVGPTVRVLACAVVLVAGCSAPSSTPLSTTPAAPPTTQPAESCPVVPTDAPGPTRSAMVLDYVDFIHFGGREYLSGILAAAPIDRADLGELVTRSRCSFSELNTRTGRNPGAPRDGDTAFLTTGTPIYAVRGWAPACRLAAEHDGRLSVYLATDQAADHARAASCAVRT